MPKIYAATLIHPVQCEKVSGTCPENGRKMMNNAATVLMTAAGALTALGFSFFAWLSIHERERRAARVSVVMAGCGVLLVIAGALLPDSLKLVGAALLIAGGIGTAVLFVLPFGHVERGQGRPHKRIDERTIMFARARLKPGSPHYTAYYDAHPEHQEIDDQTRALPGLLSMEARFANALHFAAAEACFSVPEALRESVDGPVASPPYTIDAAAITPTIKGLTQYFGARNVGITPLESYHVYTHIGRGSGEYGAPIELDHTYAIAFTVEMGYDMMGPAPDSPEVLEAAKQYSEAAQIAVQLAATIRKIGYEARAHIDGNYRVIAPLVARDAGLGEIGRMGLLMTPDLGPRVRIGVVTTTLPLIPDVRTDNTSVLDFCRICKKCADNCPSRSIPLDDRREIDGALRWQIDAERCFRLWNILGTDCGRCMAVCPYSHPDNAAHNIVRWAIRQSGAARRAALLMDDTFYGRTPDARPIPEWAAIALEQSDPAPDRDV